MHAAVMGRTLVIRGEGKPEVNRLAGATYAVECGTLALAFHVHRGYRRLKKRHIPAGINWLLYLRKRLRKRWVRMGAAKEEVEAGSRRSR